MNNTELTAPQAIGVDVNLQIGSLRRITDIAREIMGRTPRPETAVRWAVRGTRGRILPTVKVGGVRLTTRAAFLAWAAAVAAPPNAPASAPTTIDAASADRVLSAFGLGRDDTQKVRRVRRGA